MSRMFFLRMLTFVGLVRSVPSASLSGLGSNTDILIKDDFFDFIIGAQRTYCLKSAICHSFMTSVSAVNVTLEMRLKGQIEIQPADCCEICACDAVCCCESDTQYPQMQADTLSCLYPQIKPYYLLKKSYPSSRNSFLIKADCPTLSVHDRNTTDMLIIQNCLTNADDGGSITAPVFDTKNNITYMNKFCAECNKRQEEDLVYWDISIECNDDYFKPLTLNNTMVEVLKNEKCNAIFYPAEGIQELKCIRLIDQCNVTGKWAVYDPVIERACALYTAPYANSYMNMFCYICNVNEEKDPINKCVPDQSNPFVPISLRMLLRPDIASLKSSTSHHKLEPCVGETAFDPIQKTCAQAMCMTPKIFLAERCINVAKSIGGVGYRVFLVLTPQFSVENVTSAAQAIEDNVKRWLNQNHLLDTLYVLTIHTRTQTDTCSNNEGTSVQLFVVHMDLYFSPKYGFLKDVTSTDKLLSIKSFKIIKNNFNMSTSYNYYLAYFDHFDLKIGTSASDVELREVKEVGSTKLQRIKEDISRHLPSNYHAINLYPTSICPLIALDNSFYNITHFSWGVFVDRLDARLNKSEYVMSDDNYCHSDGEKCIFVCMDTLTRLKANYELVINLGTTFYYSITVTASVAVVVIILLF